MGVDVAREEGFLDLRRDDARKEFHEKGNAGGILYFCSRRVVRITIYDWKVKREREEGNSRSITNCITKNGIKLPSE